MHFYGSIQKVDAEKRMIWGYASTEAIDAHGETVLKSAIETNPETVNRVRNFMSVYGEQSTVQGARTGCRSLTC